MSASEISVRSPGPATGTTAGSGAGAGAPTTGSWARSISSAPAGAGAAAGAPTTGSWARSSTSAPAGAGAATAAGAGAATCAVPGSLIALATNMPPPSAATASRVRVGAILVMLGTRTGNNSGSPELSMNLLRVTPV